MPVVSICADASLPVTRNPAPLQLYMTVRCGLKLEPVAVAVTASSAKTSVGCREQEAVAGGGACSPKRKTIPDESRTLLRAPVVPAVEEGSVNRVIKYSAWMRRSAIWRDRLTSNPPPRDIAKEFSEGSPIQEGEPVQLLMVTWRAFASPNSAWPKRVKRGRRKERRGPAM